ncbi:MAG: hypothetical protein JJ864_08495 [Rhizobiaceae bacterium]|nr:hypothetical protein [Rhizobiaceae bacterium]
MPTLNIEGKRVKVDDSFLSLSPEEQNATVEEIARSLGVTGHRGHDAPEYIPPGVEGYNPETGEVERESSPVGGFIAGANDLPVIGPLMQRGAAAGSAALIAPFSDATFGEAYDWALKRQKQLIEENPGAALAGNIAGTTAILGPVAGTRRGAAALGMRGTLPQRIGMSGASGATIAGADTAVRGGDAADVGVSALLGAGIGAAIPGVGAGAKKLYRAGKQYVGSLTRSVVNPSAEAAHRLGSAMQADRAAGNVLSGDDIAAAARNQQPIVNADRGGETTRALARASANFSPEARDKMHRAVSDRFADQGNRIVKLISRISGGKTDDLALQSQLKDAAAAANRGAYNKAYTHPSAQQMWDEGFEQLMRAPAMQRAARLATTRGANRAAVEGSRPVQNPFIFTENGISMKPGVKPTLQFWDQVKRNLDGEIGKASRAGDKTLASDLTSLKRQLVSMLDEAVPAYRAARQGAAAFFGADDAVEAGKAFARSNRMLPEYKRGIVSMNKAEREAFETGFASELIDRATNARDRVNVVQQIFGSPEARQKMVMAFGRERAREIEAFVRVENAMDALRGAFGNSTTARQLIEAGLVGGGTWAWTGDYQTGISAAALTGAARMGARKLDERVLRHTAEMLLSDDPKIMERAIRSAASSPQYMAAVDALTRMVGITARGANIAATGRPQ